MYTDHHALMTSNGKTSQLIAGDYNEGVGAEARINIITGFTKISEKRVVVADRNNDCLRLIDLTTQSTSVFSGQYKSGGYEDGVPGRFAAPVSIVVDRRDKNQFLIVDRFNQALRIVDMKSRIVNTFVKCKSLWFFACIAHNEKSGDLYVSTYCGLHRITYEGRNVSKMSVSYGQRQYTARLSVQLPT